MTCKGCGSHAINHHCHGRDGSDGDLCDVCYWRKRAQRKPLTEDQILALDTDEVYEDRGSFTMDFMCPVKFARAIEAAHNIKGE